MNINKVKKKDITNQYDFKINPDLVIEDLSVGIQQKIKILKALYTKVNILILDEPTAVLSPDETDISFKINKSEIFSIAGAQRNGQTELAKQLQGFVYIQMEKFYKSDKNTKIKSTVND